MLQEWRFNSLFSYLQLRDKSSSVHWRAGWVDFENGFNAVKKIKISTSLGIEFLIPQTFLPRSIATLLEELSRLPLLL
jgi:hypothetical protein